MQAPPNGARALFSSGEVLSADLMWTDLEREGVAACQWSLWDTRQPRILSGGLLSCQIVDSLYAMFAERPQLALQGTPSSFLLALSSFGEGVEVFRIDGDTRDLRRLGGHDRRSAIQTWGYCCGGLLWVPDRDGDGVAELLVGTDQSSFHPPYEEQFCHLLSSRSDFADTLWTSPTSKAGWFPIALHEKEAGLRIIARKGPPELALVWVNEDGLVLRRAEGPSLGMGR